MTRLNLRLLFHLWVNGLLMKLRLPGGCFFWVPAIGIGYFLLMMVIDFFYMAPFFLFLLFLGTWFSYMLYPQELRYYIVCGINLKYVILGKNIETFTLGAGGALICAFGFQWNSSITLQESISILLYFGFIIFPLLTAFNYVAVLKHFFRTNFRLYLVFFVTLGLASIPYLISWVYLKSYILCFVVFLAEFIGYYLALSGPIAILAHRKSTELIEIYDAMSPT